jgi:hypothetical protein
VAATGWRALSVFIARTKRQRDCDEWVWDDFTLGSTQTITEVQWRGAYIPAMLGLGGPVIGFTLKIYPTNQTGFEPDVAHPPLVGYTLSDNAGETPADGWGRADVQLPL